MLTIKEARCIEDDCGYTNFRPAKYAYAPPETTQDVIQLGEGFDGRVCHKITGEPCKLTTSKWEFRTRKFDFENKHFFESNWKLI